jgi:hypothetical protein
LLQPAFSGAAFPGRTGRTERGRNRRKNVKTETVMVGQPPGKENLSTMDQRGQSYRKPEHHTEVGGGACCAYLLRT